MANFWTYSTLEKLSSISTNRWYKMKKMASLGDMVAGETWVKYTDRFRRRRARPWMLDRLVDPAAKLWRQDLKGAVHYRILLQKAKKIKHYFVIWIEAQNSFQLQAVAVRSNIWEQPIFCFSKLMMNIMSMRPKLKRVQQMKIKVHCEDEL